MRLPIYTALMVLFLLPMIVSTLVPGTGILSGFTEFPGLFIIGTLLLVVAADITYLSVRSKRKLDEFPIYETRRSIWSRQRQKKEDVAPYSNWIASIIVIAIALIGVAALAGHLLRFQIPS